MDNYVFEYAIEGFLFFFIPFMIAFIIASLIRKRRRKLDARAFVKELKAQGLTFVVSNTPKERISNLNSSVSQRKKFSIDLKKEISFGNCMAFILAFLGIFLLFMAIYYKIG